MSNSSTQRLYNSTQAARVIPVNKPEVERRKEDKPETQLSNPRPQHDSIASIALSIEQYNSLSDLEKEHTKLVYLRKEEDKRREVEYVMSKILGFYKECLELGPEYLTGIDDEGEVM
ncbi:hypothetical protein Tco_1003513 [Tanacetum coccineum]|uniref:Uncharacterized protein n=1 Tax=Tanacetum coccineum TaxID=301880 RepID=A0ABQ5F9I0_9ASTR